MSVSRLTALGKPAGLVRILTQRLQNFDMQPGISNPFRDLDCDHLISWLDRILELDAASGYPLLLASHVVSQVLDGIRQRAMLDFVYRKCLQDPARRWRWMAHAGLITRHRLNDQQLALKYARAIADGTDGPSVPSWTKQMYISLLADLGEHEAARILLGGLIARGTVTDAHEQHVLLGRLKELGPVENSSVSSKP